VLTTPTDSDIAAIVHDQIRRLLIDRFGEPKSFTGEDRLNGTLGLKSLDLAELVVALEETLGADPFAKLVPITDVRTVNDLVCAYQAALVPGCTQPDALRDELRAARSRGTRRRAERS
jgi:acyl carrier protein